MARLEPALGGIFEDAVVAVRFLLGLPRFLRTPFTLDQARDVLRRRLDGREQGFLELVGRAVSSPRNPYALLLQDIGCELGDLERLVRDEGVEGTCRILLRKGVYLTVDEFKGRRPTVRGSRSFDIRPEDLRNPAAVVHGLAQSGGSRGRRTVVPIDFAFVADHAINTHLTLDAHGGYRWRHAHWGVPGGTAVTNLLEFAKGGNPPVRWFTPVRLSTPGIHPRYRVGASALRLASRACGVPLPGPVHVPLDEPLPIAAWMAETLRKGRTPHLWTFASSAVLVAEAARQAGFDLTGAYFTAGGEPTTNARKSAVERSGARILPRFGTTETDIFAFACARPQASDDMHLLLDRHAVIQADGGSSFPPGALLVTSLLRSAPILLLNVSLGDRAELGERVCGCRLERLGWGTHITRARSYEKLTAGGITFLDTDVIHVLEEVLPGRFGGRPTDYQLLESEDEAGRPVVRLLVHPDVGVLDEHAVADEFLRSIGGGSEGRRMMELAWRSGEVFRVERRVPRRTASGKIQHLHLESD